MVDTDDTRHMTWVWHKLSTGELKRIKGQGHTLLPIVYNVRAHIKNTMTITFTSVFAL